jgi:hypothetical protein
MIIGYAPTIAPGPVNIKRARAGRRFARRSPGAARRRLVAHSCQGGPPGRAVPTPAAEVAMTELRYKMIMALNAADIGNPICEQAAEICAEIADQHCAELHVTQTAPIIADLTNAPS